MTMTSWIDRRDPQIADSVRSWQCMKGRQIGDRPTHREAGANRTLNALEALRALDTLTALSTRAGSALDALCAGRALCSS
jgi:hypothetical protein